MLDQLPRGFRSNHRRLSGGVAVALLVSACLGARPCVAATIAVSAGDGALEGFNDPTPTAPVGGNSGVTLGSQRTIAIEFAAAIWAGQLGSPVTIEINASFDPLLCDGTGAVLASAGPATVHRDFDGSPQTSTWYPQALGNRFAGIDLDPASGDVNVTFNSALGPSCASGLEFYYGLDASPPAGKIDIVTTALHEIAHGLGFLSLVSTTTGAPFLGYFDPYSRLLEQHSSGSTHEQLAQTQCAAVIRSGSDLHFIGPRTRTAAASKTTGVDDADHVRMYAPNPPLVGSSVSHFDIDVAPDELMEPSYVGANHDVGMALALLEDVGWASSCGDSVVDLGEACDDESPCCDATCSFAPLATSCDDDNVCTTVDGCDGNGVCAGSLGGLVCDDGQACTADTCDPAAGCTFSAIPEGGVCNDGNACTAGEVCTDDVCAAVGVVDCDDGDLCTVDGCDTTSGCIHQPNVGSCDDGDACTWGDKCTAGLCSGAPLLCDDGVACTIDTCVPATGCTFTPFSGACSDGDACTYPDACIGGICQPGPLVNCNDASECTVDSCLPASGCFYTNLSGGCDDATACTTGDACVGGQCVGTPVDCNDANQCTDDVCNAASGCSNPLNTSPCDDGNACSSGDVCQAGACVSGPSPDCDDGNPCTDDSCELSQGCSHSPNVDDCDDGFACTQSDVCSEASCRGEWDAQACALDRHIIYKARSQPLGFDDVADSLQVSDPLLSDVVQPKSVRTFALVASGPEGGPFVPELGLACRKFRRLVSGVPVAEELDATCALGEFSLRIRRGVSLCGPATVATGGAEAPPAASHSRDAFRCYKAKTLAGTDTRGLVENPTDVLGVHQVRLSKLREVCAPAGLDGAFPVNPDAWLLCFKAKALTGPTHASVTANESTAAHHLSLIRAKLLCLPATVVLP
ncbi:MAG: hypothetical protein ACI8TX_001147 [Hyphomicrobiaceae bacterium]